MATGVDEDRRRLVLVSDSAVARDAALARADVQAGLSDMKVIVVRPSVISVGKAVEIVTSVTGSPVLTSELLVSLPNASQGASQDEVNAAFAPLVLPIGQQVSRWLQNARGVGGFSVMAGVAAVIEQLKGVRFQDRGDGAFDLDLSALVSAPADTSDAALGICGLPLYALSNAELELVHSGVDRDAIEAVLSKHGILQYFFPPADGMALAFIDRGPRSPEQVIDLVGNSPDEGHPYGPLEVFREHVAVTELIDALKDRGLATEGEIGYELTAEGERLRATVRWQAREGTISKMLNGLNTLVDVTIFRSG